MDYGALPENLYGIDLLEDKIAEAQRLQPNLNLTWGNAEQLPYQDAFFDIVLQFTVFTSILDAAMTKNLAREMLRVLKPKGIIVWYDFFVGNPSNPDVRGVGRREIRRLFPRCGTLMSRVTLAMPLARAVDPRSALLAYLLQGIPLLCTHYLGVIQPSSSRS
jgi:ubiquinone/menaquinone biosynthesis C-methylase UbiE